MVDQAEVPPPMKTMEGFGSEQMSSPFNYGSVNDCYLRNDTLEQKLKKKYWKTKQAVIQKLGKDQDEFVVAGDAEIDNKLEKAYHLRSSCSELLKVVDRYMARLQNVSVQESLMGEFLKTWSETEYTNAGEVMQNMGKLQLKDSKNRQNIVPPLIRMRGEFHVFRDSAIRDLDLSIQRLEKARMEYRATLLWMKDVSEKLHNPDYSNQLIRFREAQATVKEAKRCFEKLKVDLGEKIDMVSASRCNLLSRSLPNYQKAMLDYSDTAASEFHQLLTSLRTHHHHQYTVLKVLEEIRDLEAEEMPFEEGLVVADDELSSLALPEVKPFPLENGDGNDESLLDLSKNVGSSVGDVTPSSGCGQETGATLSLQKDEEGSAQSSDLANNHLKNSLQEKGMYRRVGDAFPFDETGRQIQMNDIVLGGIVAELALQKDELQPMATDSSLLPLKKQEKMSETSASSSNCPEKEVPVGTIHTSTATEEGRENIDDLLQLCDIREDQPLPASTTDPSCSSSTTSTGESGAGGQQDSLFNKWNSFSAFMSSATDDVQSPLAGWVEEFSNTTAISPPCDTLTPSSAGSSTPAVSTSSASATSNLLLSNDCSSSTDAVAHDDSINQGLDVEELLGFGSGSSPSEQIQMASSSASELLSEELRALDLSPLPADLLTSGSKVECSLPPLLQPIGSTLYPVSVAQPLMQPVNSTFYPSMGQQPMMFRSPVDLTQEPPIFSTHSSKGFVNIPPKFGLSFSATQSSSSGAIAGLQLPANKSASTVAPRVVGRDVDDQGRKDKAKGKSWMNLFAHLDPLANEKA